MPRVSTSLNAQVTVSDASISPFKEVVLQNLRVQTTGAEPLITVREVRARYRLMDILGGNIHVEEVVLSSPTVTVVENPDQSSNLDPVMRSQPGKAKEPPANGSMERGAPVAEAPAAPARPTTARPTPNATLLRPVQ